MTVAEPVVRLAVVCAGLWLAAKGWAVAVGPGPQTPGRGGPWRRELLWWLWPGLERRRFLFHACEPPAGGERLRGAAFTLLGAGLFLLGGRLTDRGEPLIGGVCAAVGFVFALHFGAFHLLALALRRGGIDAEPLMNRPLSAATLAEFWGRRWNTAFARLTRDGLFAPLARRFSAGIALWAGFALSGAVHEAALTGPVFDRPGALYGGPFLYFLLQAAGTGLERRLRKAGRLGGVSNRLYAAAWLILPTPLLLSPAFLIDAAGPAAAFALSWLNT
ncbi:MBOAT family protein [Alienimonas sp. DA493]|uniref:MBOAT family protein n=1 Tax=Alienimonas sp. DA493 TaxID=3373605 RepID=UPI003755295A